MSERESVKKKDSVCVCVRERDALILRGNKAHRDITSEIMLPRDDPETVHVQQIISAIYTA